LAEHEKDKLDAIHHLGVLATCVHVKLTFIGFPNRLDSLQDTGRTGFLSKLSRTTNEASLSNTRGVVTLGMYHKTLSMRFAANG
jgi:hypothetical protein